MSDQPLRDVPLEEVWPALATATFEMTSLEDETYNCVALAAGDNTTWWEPDPLEVSFWPEGVTRDYSVAAYTAVFEAQGYQRCPDGDSEPNTVKVAVFALSDGSPKHVARQLPDGRWISKLGDWEDITHELAGLTGDFYGDVVQFLRRPVPAG